MVWWIWLIVIMIFIFGVYLYNKLIESKFGKQSKTSYETEEEMKNSHYDKENGKKSSKFSKIFKKKEKEPERPVVRKRDIEVDGIDFEQAADYESFNTDEIKKTQEGTFQNYDDKLFEKVLNEEEKQEPIETETSYNYDEDERKQKIEDSFKNIYSDNVYEIEENIYEIERELTDMESAFAKNFEQLSPEMKIMIIDNLKRKSDL